MKKSRTTKRVLSIMMVLTMVVALSASAFAESVYEPINGGETTMTKYMVFNDDTATPSATFTFSIQPGEEDLNFDSNSNKVSYFAGPMGNGSPSIEDAVFTREDTKYTQASENDAVTLEDGQAFAKETVKIDLSGVTFDEPGVYRYVITEDVKDDLRGVTYDTQNQSVPDEGGTLRQRYLDIYVVSDDDHLEIASYALHERADDLTMTENDDGSVVLDDKSDGFVNERTLYNLKVTEEVTGNQASKNKYFEVVIEIDNSIPGNTYDIDISNADPTVEENKATDPEYYGKENPTQVVIDEDGHATITVYLKHGQSVEIIGLEPETKYHTSEDPQDYTLVEIDSSPSDDTPDSEDLDTTEIKDDDMEGNVDLTYVNTRNGVVPTGIMMSALPGAIVVVLGIMGMAIMAAHKKDKSEEA